MAFFIKRIKETFCKGLKFMSKYFFLNRMHPDKVPLQK